MVYRKFSIRPLSNTCNKQYRLVALKRANGVLELKLIQLAVVIKLQHWNHRFYNNRGYSGSRSCPLITSSWTQMRSTWLWVMLATSLWLMRARCLSFLWSLLWLRLTTTGDLMLLQDTGFFCLGRCKPDITWLAVLHPAMNPLVLAKVT